MAQRSTRQTLPTKMKFLVYGHKGWIGGQVMDIITQQGHEGVGSSVRADDEVEVAKELDEVKPDRVVSLIGRTRGEGYNTIDYLEQKGKLVENMRDNLWGPMVLAFLCKERGIHFTYMGTGCIFHYDEEHPIGGTGFTEASLPNFFGSAYSTCKGFTDRLMHLMPDSVLNIRIRMPITPDHSPYNFITKIVKYQKVINIPNSMTVLPELLPVMIRMAADKKTGTVNMTNPGAISHNEVLELYKKHVDPDFWYENFTIEEQDKILLSGRSNNLLETEVLKEYAPAVNDIHTAVENVCKQMARDCGKIDHGKQKA
eukprot:TRINITY_DN1473_c1_g2_i2.p1 TRINITY_DN1473_c1_g2~~TRINITY_DN1473_c1_g2_i2.p1  ORF type:complete len:313 (+),score=79.49 TRINITY_DN1473_c1_g2_i2:97-1035(+)